MPNKCVVGGCSNAPDLPNGIALHTIPFFDDERHEAKKRRRKWVDFVRAKRAKWEPTKNSVICSKHFKLEELEQRYTNIPGLQKPAVPRLKRDSLGVCVFPSLHPGKVDSPNKPQTGRMRRKILRESLVNDQPRNDSDRPSPTQDFRDHEADSTCGVECLNEEKQHSSEPSLNVSDDDIENITQLTVEQSQGSEITRSTENLVWLEQKRRLENRVKTLRSVVQKRRMECKKLKKKLRRKRLPKCKNKKTQTVIEQGDTEQIPEICEEVFETMTSDSEGEITEEEPDDEDDIFQTETEEESEDSGEDTTESPNRVSMQNTNLRTQPKHIVFLSQLLLLFKFCHFCKDDDPLVEVAQVGTEVIVTTSCKNPKCEKKENVWHSQPTMPGLGIPAGNFLLCMAILLAGGSITKVSQIFKHMGLSCVSLNTYFKHQRTKLFPSIYIYWQMYQKKLLEKVKSISSGVVLAGDGRHDSMGHSAKYGVYTIFCSSIFKIIHFDLVQRNQVGNSTGMEFKGFKQCMEFLIGYGILITTFISDRHIQIACHMKKVLTNIVHYFDIWHLKKKIRKVLKKISQEKGCEAVKEWIKPCERHLYWSATSTFSGNGALIWAKFKSFLSHIIDKHKDLPDALFNKCAHKEIHPRRWLSEGSELYKKVYKALTKNSLMRGIKQASPLAQTSCLEGFHSLVNQFAPKMIAFSYAGMYCRHILAILHFNCNLQREVQVKEGSTEQRQKVVFPKFKNGEATIRDVRIKPNFEYVEEIYNTFLTSNQKELKEACLKIKEMTPAPMNSMLDKQCVEEALKKRKERKAMAVKDVPPTSTVPQVSEETTSGKGPTRVPLCRACKQPMKGHKNVTNCPKNQ